MIQAEVGLQGERERGWQRPEFGPWHGHRGSQRELAEQPVLGNWDVTSCWGGRRVARGGGWDGALEEGRRCQNFKRGSILYVYSSKSLTRIWMYWTEGFDFVYGEFMINVHKWHLSQNTRKYASSVRSWEMQSSLVSNQHCQLKCYLHDSGRNVQCCSPFLPPSLALSWKLQQWATKWKSVTWGKTSLSLTLSAKCFSMCLATVSLDVVTYMGLGYWTTNSLNPAPLNTLTS